MDWSFFSTPLGLAVIAPTGAFLGALVGVGISSWTTRSTHQSRLRADRELAERKVAADTDLAERKFSFDKELAERKVALDRELADWRRRTEMAEQVLADFYQVRDIFRWVRSSGSFGHEGQTRKAAEGETEALANLRNAYFVPIERLNKEAEFFARFFAERYRFQAFFGPEAAEPFHTIRSVHSKVLTAAEMLISSSRDGAGPSDLSKDLRHAIGWVESSNDTIQTKIDEAIARIEATCRPLFEVRPT